MAERWIFRGTTIARRGRASKQLNVTPDPTPQPTGRDALVYGTYRPDETTTGVLPGTVLTDYAATPQSTNTYTFPGATTVTDKIIYGDVRPPTNGGIVILKNCLLVGGNHVPSSASAVVDCKGARPGTGRMVLIDCTIKPRRPALNRDCIAGHKFNIYRSDLSHGVDGIGAFILSSNGTSTSVEAFGNYIHDLVYFYPDYNNGVSGATVHTDGTHNDGIQVQGGTNIDIFGNWIRSTSFLGAGSGTNPDKPWLLSGATKWINGAGVIIQKQSVTAPLDETVKLRKNWIEGGLSTVNMKPGRYTVEENIISRRTALGSGHSRYYLRGDSRGTTTVIGLGTQRWEDTNALLTEPQASGIHWNG